MAHFRDIPVAYSYQAEKRHWELVSFSKAGTSSSEILMGELLGSRPLATDHLFFKDPFCQIKLHYSHAEGVAASLRPEPVIEIYSPEINNYLRSVLDTASAYWDYPDSHTHLLVSWPGENLVVREVNPWTMRDEFLRIPETNDALLGFLNHWGMWDTTGSFHEIHSAIWNLGTPSPMAVLPALVWARRKELRQAMLGKADVWLAERASLGYTHRRERYPYIGITDRAVSKAIETTVTLDHLGRTKWRTCKRADCTNIFPVESDHGKIYCQQYCAHIVSVRRKRAAVKRAKRTPSPKRA